MTKSFAKKLHVVILAGGSGTRFWPKSTSRKPKQFLDFYSSNGPLLKQTVDRFAGIQTQFWVVTTKALEDLTRKTLGDRARILAEPMGRNTAPCIFWAAQVIAKEDPEAVMAVMPSDHLLGDIAAFKRTFASAVEHAALGEDLVALGVHPAHPETGYGYLKKGTDHGGGCFKVEQFVEKPDLARAKKFVESGEYLWNGGMFVWRVDTVLQAFQKLLPAYAKAWSESGGDVEKAYPKMEATSIDFGVMEKASNVVTFNLDCGWNDLGSWTSMEHLVGSSKSGNFVCAGQVSALDSSGNIVDVGSKRVALLGVKDLVIVEADGVLMIADKGRAQDIKKLVELVRGERPDLV